MKKPNILKSKRAASPHDASLISDKKTRSKSGVGLDFITEDTPQPGEVREIADGVFWLRF